MSSRTTTRFRRHGALPVAALIVFIGTLPLASQHWALASLLLLPLLFGVWALRSGTDADADGLRIRALLGQRRIPWSTIMELATDRHGRAAALLTDGRVVPLAAVPADGLPQLVRASGHAVGEVSTPPSPG